MPGSTLTFHGALLDLLDPRLRRAGSVEVAVLGGRSAKDAIESSGIPHTEVDLIVANGRSVGLDHRLADGEAVDVYGFDRPEPLAALPGLAPPAPRPPRFVLDGHLGRLARYLRLLGFDTAYDRDAGDEALAQRSAQEDRVLLTRDRGLLKRSVVRVGFLVRDDDPVRQLRAVLRRFDLAADVRAFTRCIRCNGAIRRVGADSVQAELAGEPRTLRFFSDFGRCESCGRIYWPGSHFERMSSLVKAVIGEPGAPG